MSAPVRTHVLVGDPDQVRAALSRAQADGRLMNVSGAALEVGGRVRVTADLVDPTPPRTRWQRIRPWLVRLGWLLAVAAAGVAAWLLVWAVIGLVSALVAVVAGVAVWIGTYWPVLVAVGLVLLLLTGGASCRGVHCGGCRG